MLPQPISARAWLSVLEASDIVFLLPPYRRNFGKRLVKTPKRGRTVTPDYIRAGQKAARIAGDEALPPWLVYGGDESYERSGVRVIGWRHAGN